MSEKIVLYIGGFELPDKNAAAHRVLSNAKILREQGYKVVFISVDKNLDNNSNILSTKRDVQGFDVWFRPYPKSNYEWLYYLITISDIKRVMEQYNNVKGVILYNYQSVSFYRIMSFCKKNNIKIMADCSEWYSVKGYGFVYKLLKGGDSFLRMNYLHKKVDKLIVISKYLEEFYKKYVDSVLLYALVDLDEDKWKSINNTIREEKEERISFIYSGTPGKHKDNLGILIKSFFKLRKRDDFILRVIGVSKNDYLNIWPETKDALDKLDDKIEFLGYLPHIESLKLLKKSDFMIFFRDNSRVTNAGFPTKFVESISCGVPVITNKTSDLHYFFKDNKNGFIVNKPTLDEVYNIINDILNMKRKRINELKKQVLFNSFDYRNYLKQEIL